MDRRRFHIGPSRRDRRNGRLATARRAAYGELAIPLTRPFRNVFRPAGTGWSGKIAAALIFDCAVGG